MLARMERSVRALFCVFQPVFMRVCGNLSSIFRTFLTLQNGRKLQSFRMFTGFLRSVFLRSFADISGVFRRSFYASFGRLSRSLSNVFQRIFVDFAALAIIKERIRSDKRCNFIPSFFKKIIKPLDKLNRTRYNKLENIARDIIRR